MSKYKPLKRKEVEGRFIASYEREKLQKALPWVRGVVTKAAEEIERVEREAERYRAALEFYAKRGNYDPPLGPDALTSAVQIDNGKTAREALHPTQPAEGREK